MSINDMDMHEYAGGQGLLVKTMENNHHSKVKMTPYKNTINQVSDK